MILPAGTGGSMSKKETEVVINSQVKDSGVTVMKSFWKSRMKSHW